MARKQAAFRVKYQWRPNWIFGEDVIIAKTEADARVKTRERLLHTHIDDLQVVEVEVCDVTKVVDVTL